MQLVKSDREVPSADSKWECSTHRRQMSLGLREANGILDYQKCGPGLGGVSGHEYLLAGERTDRVADRLDGHEEDKLWGQYVGLTFRGRTGIRQTEACLQQMEMLPKVVSYSSTISDCEKGTLWQRALGFAKFLQQMEVPPNAISHSSAISACEKGWPWRQARRPVVCRQQIETLPKVISYRSTISACEKGWPWRQALGLCTCMQQMEVLPKFTSFSSTFSFCEKVWEWLPAPLPVADIQHIEILSNAISYSSTIRAWELLPMSSATTPRSVHVRPRACGNLN
eukprot:TRINITY_DN11546_c0_g1_i5.p1 TRINITY_DN11546_c0_g1~~TRINITY_DN11546_c0_g1_i5.p1  ORF type:complete len:283 (-),score=21.76 TRINITY_DN11546_c0_g1_i5:77-925(-)